jgi:hypothetical protein
MEETITLKPVFWRLAIWKGIPFYIAALIGLLIDWLIHNSISSFWWGWAIGAIVGGVIAALFLYYKKVLDINIAHGEISGPSSGYATRATFLVSKFDKSSIYQQSALQKIMVGQVLQSFDGEKIVFAPFIYEHSTVKAFRKLIEQK